MLEKKQLQMIIVCVEWLVGWRKGFDPFILTPHTLHSAHTLYVYGQVDQGASMLLYAVLLAIYRSCGLGYMPTYCI